MCVLPALALTWHHSTHHWVLVTYPVPATSSGRFIMATWLHWITWDKLKLKSQIECGGELGRCNWRSPGDAPREQIWTDADAMERGRKREREKDTDISYIPHRISSLRRGTSGSPWTCEARTPACIAPYRHVTCPRWCKLPEGVWPKLGCSDA